MNVRFSRSLSLRLLLLALTAGVILGLYSERVRLWREFNVILADSETEPIPVQVIQKESIRVRVPATGEVMGQASVEIHNSCFVVPESAVSTNQEKPVVYVEQGGEFVARSVVIAPGSVGQVVILEGIEAGERIALRNPTGNRKLHLPDFNTGSAGASARPRGRRGRPR